jgi:hypothetical protein
MLTYYHKPLSTINSKEKNHIKIDRGTACTKSTRYNQHKEKNYLNSPCQPHRLKQLASDICIPGNGVTC